MTKKIKPPGQARPYPKPIKYGKIPFSSSKNGIDGETAYWIFGDLTSSKIPLVALHGGPGATHSYLLPIALINQDYGIPVIFYDQIGCGASTRFKERLGDNELWTPELFMEELDNVKDYLGLKQFDLLGQSWGGMLAGQFAIEKQPHGLRKLVIADSPSDMRVWVAAANRLRSYLPKDIQKVLDRGEKEGKTDSPEYQEAEKYFYRLHVCRIEPWPKELTDSFECLAEDNTVYHTMCGPNEFLITGNLKNWSITHDLKRITDATCPGGLLVMNGYYDEAQDETMAPFFTNPSCRTKWLRYPLSSHTPFLEESERFLSDLGSFLIQDY